MVDFVGLSQPFLGDFSQGEIDNYVNVFKGFDVDGNGTISMQELNQAIVQAGENINDAELQGHISAVDLNSDGIQFNEFLQLMKNIKGSGFGKRIEKVGSNTMVISDQGARHQFSDEEKEAFAEHINSCLEGDADADARLPLVPGTNDIFVKSADGVLLAKLINFSVPDTIDERALNTKLGMNIYLKTENGNLVINSAKGIGCNVVNIGAQDLIEAREHLILGLIWQIIRIGLLSQITLQNFPELFRLLEEGEEMSDLLKLKPEEILLRWFNYHLKNAGSDRRVNNFSSDIKDSECYTILLNQLDKQCDKSPLQENDLNDRAEKMLVQSDKLGCRKFVRPKDIVSGHPKLNLAFVANLFNTCPGLEALTEEEKGALEDWLFNSEGSREARAFSLWINSLGIDPFVNNLFEDLRDGCIILRVMDKVKPGSVDWKRVNEKIPLNRFKRVENCNYAVDLGKDPFNFSLVGIGGTDLVDGNQTLTLALVWQLMRCHVLTILGALAQKLGKSEVTDDDLIKLANERVAATTGRKMSSFKDSSLSNSLFFLDLLNTIKDTVDQSLVTPGESEEDALLNAKYTISIARKIGCTIFLLPEDIIEVKPKMILTLVGSILSQVQ